MKSSLEKAEGIAIDLPKQVSLANVTSLTTAESTSQRRNGSPSITTKTVHFLRDVTISSIIAQATGENCP